MEDDNIDLPNNAKKLLIEGYKRLIKECQKRIESYREGIRIEERTIDNYQAKINGFDILD